MILHSKKLQEQSDELEFRKWLVNELGEEDESKLARWLHENQQEARGAPYLPALAELVRGISEHGRSFANNLLEMANKPKHIRDMEIEIIDFAKPLIERLSAKARKFKVDPVSQVPDHAIIELRDELMFRLQEFLRRMYKDAHRATMKGALIVSIQPTPDGEIGLDVSKLVRILSQPEPMAATAAMSWGAS